MYDIWFDLVNSPHVLLFKPLIKDLNKKYDILITVRNKLETIELAEKFNLEYSVYGRDPADPVKKASEMIRRTLKLSTSIPHFKISISAAQAMNVAVSRFRGSKSYVFLDNDIKLKYPKNLLQKFEVKLKKRTDAIIIPKASKKEFSKLFNDKQILTYPGFKEHLSIYDFEPNRKKIEEVPFEDYIVIRPEVLSSFYTGDIKTISVNLLKEFDKKGINTVFLPRKEEKIIFDLLEKHNFNNIYIPNEALDGLNLSYFADAVLTGSGTMAREAAILGTTAVSFFPGNELLSVDKNLIEGEKLFHSRNIKKIVDYVISNLDVKKNPEFEKAKKVKKVIKKIIGKQLQENGI